MPAMFLSRRWTRQPTGLLRPNAEFMARPVLLWDGRSTHDLVVPQGPLKRTGAIQHTVAGTAFRQTVGGGRFDTGARLPSTSRYKPSGDLTLVAYFIKRTSAGSSERMGGIMSGTDGISIGEGYGLNYSYAYVGGVQIGLSSQYVLDKPAVAIATKRGATARFYVNGALHGSTTSAGSTTYDASFTSAFWGGNVDGGSKCTTDLLYMAVDNSGWSDAKCLALCAEPWMVFSPERRPVFYSLGGSVYNESLSEAVSASDSLSAAAAFGGALTEAASASEALAAVAALAGDLSEAASASDVVAAAAAYADSLSEAASASESISASGAVVGALSEAASADDALSASAALSDALSEAASAADALDASASFGSDLSESAAASDEIDGSIGASTYAAELVESVSASDSLIAAAVYASAIVEAVTAEDAITAGAVMAAVLSEVASADDSVGASLVIAAAIAEAVSAADGWSGSVGSQVFEVELAEAASASDAWVALGVLARHGVRGAKAVQTQMSTRANVQTARRYN